MKNNNPQSNSSRKISIIAKALINQFVFLGLHYAYDFFPTTFVLLFSSINESVFQHLKIGYFSYMLTNLIEFLILKKQVRLKNFITFRTFSTMLLPWIMFLLFFLPEAVFGKVDNYIHEIVVERHIEQITPSKGFTRASICMFLIAGFLFIVYTFRLPWFDVFAIPPGWE